MPKLIDKDRILLGSLHVALSACGMLTGLSIFAILVGGGSLTGNALALEMGGRLGGSIALIMLLFSLPGLIGGIGLLRGKTWGPCLTLFVSAINLPVLPFGSAIGAYSLWVYWNNDSLCPAQRRGGADSPASLSLSPHS